MLPGMREGISLERERRALFQLDILQLFPEQRRLDWVWFTVSRGHRKLYEIIKYAGVDNLQVFVRAIHWCIPFQCSSTNHVAL